MLDRIFVREDKDDEYTAVHNRFKVGVLGMGTGTGVSLIATALARELAGKEKTAYVEIAETEKKGFLYDSLGMDKRFAGRQFHDFHFEIQQGVTIRNFVNPDEGINWALLIPKTNSRGMFQDNENRINGGKGMAAVEMCSLVNNIAARTVVSDITAEGYALENVLKEMDELIFVIDPLPSKLIGNYEKLCLMKEQQMKGKNVIWVVNKYNEGVNKREFNDFVRLKQLIKIPVIPQEYLYEAEYNCRIPYTLKNIKNIMESPLKEVIHKLNT